MEEKIVKNEAELMARYKKSDVEGGYLTNPDQIEYVKASQKFDVINNLMLGDYNEDGDYIIAEDILRELVALDKLEMQKYADTVFATSFCEFGDKDKLEFSLVYKNLERQIASATLKLLEKVEKIGGYYINTNSFIVGTFNDNNSKFFEEDAKKVFRIYPSIKTIKGDAKANKAIVNRLTLMKEIKTKALPLFEQIEKENFIKRMEFLMGDAKYTDIIAKFDAERKRITKLFDERFAGKRHALHEEHALYYTYLNQLLNDFLDLQATQNPKGNIFEQAIKQFGVIDKIRNGKITECALKVKEEVTKALIVEKNKQQDKKIEKEQPVKGVEKSGSKPKVIEPSSYSSKSDKNKNSTEKLTPKKEQYKPSANTIEKTNNTSINKQIYTNSGRPLKETKRHNEEEENINVNLEKLT